MSIRYLFSSSGEYVAFLQQGYMFAPDCEWIGFVPSGNQVYSSDGTFFGYLLDDDRVARRKDEPRRPRVMRPMRPMRPLRPLRPLKRLRMPRLPYPWEDAFDRGIEGLALSTPSGLQSLDELEGSRLVAADGKYLGRVTRNAYDAESLANEYGTYGNSYNSISIFNDYGTYGNPYNQLSPYNEYSRTPPRFERDGKIIAYLSANEFVSPRVDPKVFQVWIKGG